MKTNVGVAVFLIAIAGYGFYLEANGRLLPTLRALFGFSGATGTGNSTVGAGTVTAPDGGVITQLPPIAPVQTNSGWKLPAIPFTGTPIIPGFPSFAGK